jgi:tripartite-type tricarboxylate transporter receptor subunit TctC
MSDARPPGLGRRTGLIGLTGLGLAGLGLPYLSRGASAQAAWPDRPVRLVLPFGAGGAIDTLARTVANAFPAHANGQNLIVENRSGAGGTIAGAVVAQARPDGSTLMMADLGANAIGKEMQPSLPYDPMQSFTAICHVATLPLVLVVPSALPVNDLAGFIALAKRDPEIPYAHPGIGYVGHLTQELFLRRTGLTMTPIAYRSGAEVVRSLVANDTKSSIITVSTSMPLLRDGRLKALAVCSAERVPALPDVPTLSESLSDFEASVWHGIVGPAGMAPDMVAEANRIFNVVVQQPEVKRVVEQTQAGRVIGGTAEEFAAFIRAEHARWVPIIQAAGIRIE